MEERAKIIRLLIMGILLVAACAAAAVADPAGADKAVVIDSQRGVLRTTTDGKPAEAGNVTEMVINSTSITKTWQGYYGNVTGKITLDDALNMTMYNWMDAIPQGEIYASNSSTLSWANVNCFNLSGFANGKETNSSGNTTYYEAYLGLSTTSDDGVNDTFITQTHSAFNIGTRGFAADTCSTVKTYVNNGPQSTTSDFIELILYDNSTAVAVFATFINNTVTGFDNKVHDFQLMVPVEGGHDTPPTTDTFYFYVELE